MTALLVPTPPVVLPETHVQRRQEPKPKVEQQPGYSMRWLTFYAVPLHLQELESAALNPSAGRAILERHSAEFYALRHARPACMCRCSGRAHQGCEEWRALVGGHGTIRAGQLDDVGREIGRTSLVHPPMPAPAELFDLYRLSREQLRSRVAQIRYLNGVAA
jgi:hypothetical protein